MIAESCKLPARVWRALFAGIVAFRATDELHRVRAPTLVLWGDRDTIFLRGEQERLRDGIAGATLRVWEGVGHALHWEDPDRFVRDLVAFVADAGGRQP